MEEESLLIKEERLEEDPQGEMNSREERVEEAGRGVWEAGGLEAWDGPAPSRGVCEDGGGPVDWKADEESNPDAPDLNGCGPCDGGYAPSQSGRAGEKREKRFFCSFCGKGFSFPKQVEIHQRVHTGEKPFSCAQCRQRFSHSGNLKRHQRVHTGEKPFGCTLCEKRFSHLHQLKMHQRIHTGERPHVCAQCGKRFSERSYLRIHQQRSHTGLCSVR